MPDFEVVEKYLGPIGMYARTEEEGWYLGALGLKRQPQEMGNRPSLTTAAAEDPAAN
jgi:hypothetical protein